MLAFGGDGIAGTAIGFASKVAGNELAGLHHRVEVDAGVDAQSVHQVEHVLGGDIAGCAFRVRTSAEAGDRQLRLYDLSSDPAETTDVAAEHRDIARKLVRGPAEVVERVVK